MAGYTALYDACVLYPAPLRDLLLQLATTDLFRAKWSNAIHEEWIRSVLADRPDLRPEQLHRTRDLMNRSARDALIENFEDLVPSIHLPDAGDRHVLAAAIRGRCDVIVTYNLKDFPKEVLVKYDVDVQHPDEFIGHQYNLRPEIVCAAAKTCRPRLKAPPKTVDDYLMTMAQQRLRFDGKPHPQEHGEKSKRASNSERADVPQFAAQHDLLAEKSGCTRIGGARHHWS